jgi:hypothetical protein
MAELVEMVQEEAAAVEGSARQPLLDWEPVLVHPVLLISASIGPDSDVCETYDDRRIPLK